MRFYEELPMHARQFNHDMAEPEPDLSHLDDQHAAEQAALLLQGEHCAGIEWKDFALAATENVCCEDDNEFALIQILLALRNNKPELAQLIYQRRFDSFVADTAEGMVRLLMGRAA